MVSRADQHLNNTAIDGGPGGRNRPACRRPHEEERIPLVDGLTDRHELEREDLTGDGRADNDDRLGVDNRDTPHGRHHHSERHSGGPPPVSCHAITSP